MVVETLGTINVSRSKIYPRTAFADLIVDYGLIEFLHKHWLLIFARRYRARNYTASTAFCGDSDAALTIVQSPILRLVYDQLKEKQDDPEIVLQVLIFFSHLLKHEFAGKDFLYGTNRLPTWPSRSCNRYVQAAAYALLDIIVSIDEDMTCDAS